MLRRLLPALLALAACSGAALAQPAAKPAAAAGPARFGDFVVRCAQTKSVAPCDLYEERANKDTGQRLLGFSIGFMPSQNRYILQIAVPLGVDLAKGVAISDGKQTTPVLPFRRCDIGACYVEVPIDRSMIDLFAKMGSDAKVQVTGYDATGPGKDYSFTFSFNGFSAAHESMVAENRAKASNP